MGLLGRGKESGLVMDLLSLLLWPTVDSDSDLDSLFFTLDGCLLLD